VVPGVLLTHMSVGLLIPPIADLPANIAKGFDVVFKFASMEQDAKDIKATSASVLNLCTVTNPSTTCSSPSLYPDQMASSQQNEINTTTQKSDITRDFGNSLSTVKRIASDKYFGTGALVDTANTLTNMTNRIDEINPMMKCYQAVPVFCGIWASGGEIVNGMAAVTKEINAFKDSDIVKQWDDNKGYLTGLHAIPWILVIGMVFFSLFWLRGGVCCCCREGTWCGCMLIFYALFWLVSFVIYLIIALVGVGIKYGAKNIEVPVLKGKPTLEEAISHIKVNYPEFWSTVFADLEDGLSLLLDSSFFFVGAALLIMLYSLVLCCCCPYRKPKDQQGSV